MIASIYNIYKEEMVAFGTMNILSGTQTFKIALLDQYGTFNASQSLASSILMFDEISGGSYNAGGKTISGVNRTGLTITLGDIVFTGLNFQGVQGALIYHVGTGKPMIHVRFSTPINFVDSDLTISWPNGLLTLG